MGNIVAEQQNFINNGTGMVEFNRRQGTSVKWFRSVNTAVAACWGEIL
ncbi:hypothetical protein CDAR_22491, partial [Caerostris darwini]